MRMGKAAPKEPGTSQVERSHDLLLKGGQIGCDLAAETENPFNNNGSPAAIGERSLSNREYPSLSLLGKRPEFPPIITEVNLVGGLCRLCD